MNDIEFDLVKEFERLVQEGGKDLPAVELEPRYNCKGGFHKMLWYHGFREKYHYCALCDHKDYTTKPKS